MKSRRLKLTSERLAELSADDLARVNGARQPIVSIDAGACELPTLGYNCSMRQSCGIVCHEPA